MSEKEVKEMGLVWAGLASRGVITASSTLSFRVDAAGRFLPIEKEGVDLRGLAKKYITDVVKGPDGQRARSLPHVFCDTTCCDSCSMPDGILVAMARREQFFAESVALVEAGGHDGLALDFEGSWGSASPEQIGDFFAQWKRALAKGRSPSGSPLELHVWTAYPIPHERLSHHVDSIVDMGAYGYRSFRNATSPHKPPIVLGQPMDKHLPRVTWDLGGNRQNAGLKEHLEWFCPALEKGKCSLGLITYSLSNVDINCTDMIRLADWGQQHDMQAIWLWSGGIPSNEWEAGLSRFAATLGDKRESCESWSALQKAASPFQSTCDFDKEHHCDGTAKIS